MSISLDAIALPDDLIWTDEFSWSPTQQQAQYTLTGALVIETGIKQAGRPITLVGGVNAAWVTRATVKSLYAKLDDPGPFTLTLHDGSTHSVVFRHDQTPIEAAPIIDYNNPDDGDLYSLTLRFIKL
jgi:molybdopterin-guanine dinucleotide biosynthesis protein A